MNAIRIRAHIASDTLHLPQLQAMMGKDVEIIILEEAAASKEPASSSKRYPLRGTVVRYDDPFDPIAETEWEAGR